MDEEGGEEDGDLDLDGEELGENVAELFLGEVRVGVPVLQRGWGICLVVVRGVVVGRNKGRGMVRDRVSF